MGWTFYGCNKLKVIDVSNWKTGKVTVMSHMFADCNSVKVLEVNNWDLSSLQSLDATFNDCDSLTTINVSKWNTGNVREFSQIFDGCDNLQYIYGMENWDTTNGRNFDEIFNRCSNLRELNFSGWDTRNLAPGHKNVNGDISKGFADAFVGPVKLEKLIIGENFSFDGNGTVKPEYQVKLPAPAAKEGYTAKWRNVETGELFDASQIPEKVAATYEAHYIANT
jgi:surface protein